MSSKKIIMKYVNYNTPTKTRNNIVKKLTIRDKNRIHKYITKNLFKLQFEMSHWEFLNLAKLKQITDPT
jgi:hypothetical protein